MCRYPPDDNYYWNVTLRKCNCTLQFQGIKCIIYFIHTTQSNWQRKCKSTAYTHAKNVSNFHKMQASVIKIFRRHSRLLCMYVVAWRLDILYVISYILWNFSKFRWCVFAVGYHFWEIIDIFLVPWFGRHGMHCNNLYKYSRSNDVT